MPDKKQPIPFEFLLKFESGNKRASEGKVEESEALYDQCASLCPEAWIGIASVALQQGKWQEAILRYEQALTHATHPKSRAVCLNNLGLILNQRGMRRQSEPYFRKAFELWKLGDTATNIALCRMYDCDMAGADSWIQRAVRMEPRNGKIWFNHALISLMKGDLRNGFREYAARWKNPESKTKKLPVYRPEWNGENINGKSLMVYAEQGAGDTIQLLRYGPLLKHIGARLLLAPQRGVGPLAETQGCWESIHEDILDRIARADVPHWDLQVPMFDLPRILRTDLQSIPPSPYLHGPWPRVYTAAGSNLKVGFSWAGSVDHAHDIWRSTHLEDWRPLFDLPGIDWYSLQVGERTIDLIDCGFPITDLSSKIGSYAHTAGIIEQMDLTISVDTSLVHLAGAMGHPCWMLTPRCPDWRWMLGREDSPWYPSLRLFRQTEDLKWSDVVERIKTELCKFSPSANSVATG